MGTAAQRPRFRLSPARDSCAEQVLIAAGLTDTQREFAELRFVVGLTRAEAAGAVIAYPPTRQGDTGTWAIYILGGVQVGLWQS